MKIGCCLPGGSFMPQGVSEIPNDIHKVIINSTKIATQLGFDYTEVGAGFLDGLTDKGMEKLTSEIQNNNLKVKIVNSFIPERFSIYDVSQRSELESYVKRIVERAALLDIHLIVFGSGKARNVPLDLTREEAAKDLKGFLELCNKEGEKNGVIIAIEPLNREECNILNTVSECASLVREMELPNVKIIADAFHMWKENEGLSALADNIDVITHIHISEPPDRTYPGSKGGEYLKDFAQKLKSLNYDMSVSAECQFYDFLQELRPTAAFMKENFK